MLSFDTLTISNEQLTHPPAANPLDNNVILEVDQLISETFVSHFEDAAGALYKNPAVFKEVMRSHQRMLEKLQETTLLVGEQAAQARVDLEREYWEKYSQLNKEVESKKQKIDRDLKESKERLSDREAALDERTRQLDDRDNTHARRDLHTKLKARIAEHSTKFQLTNETRGRRTPIHIAVIVSIFLLAALIFYTSYGFIDNALALNNTTLILVAIIKPVGLAVALLGLISWYLRWMNRWFERHAEAEFQLKQFELDIDRASWVVETALEWRFKQENQIPDQLLNSISRNLFARAEVDESVDMHPADYLASALLGRASALKLKVPGAEIDYGKSGIGKLKADSMGSGT